jgi:hypothetical protein
MIPACMLARYSSHGQEHGGIRPTFLWTFSFLKISVASSRCVFSKILHGKESAYAGTDDKKEAP